MIPVVTPTEMAAIDAAAPEPVEVLIERAGGAVARAARRLLGGTYGRRVVVVAGKGNNGNDGRVAARRLAGAGAAVRVVAPDEPLGPPALRGVDLVIDAAYGTGFVDRGTAGATGWRPFDPAGVPVLAVDIPSGVDGLTGGAVAGVAAARGTVTFAAAKPGLLLLPGRRLAGDIEVVDIGLDCARARAFWVTRGDAATHLPQRPAESHKWRAACWVVGGSPGMTGAGHLAARGAQRAGAGYVRASSPGVADDPGRPLEAVGVPLPAEGWAADLVAGADRFGSVVVGPGLGRAQATQAAVAEAMAALGRPLVVDGDGLAALAGLTSPAGGWPALRVLTPHDGEFRLLTGRPPGPDRLAEARSLATATGCVVLLKGPTTVVAEPAGLALLVTEGDERLATAGSGDVLSGIIGALLAQHSAAAPEGPAAIAGPAGAEVAARLAATAAFLHGRAGRLGPARGLVAGDLPELLPRAAADLGAPGAQGSDGVGTRW